MAPAYTISGGIVRTPLTTHKVRKALFQPVRVQVCIVSTCVRAYVCAYVCVSQIVQFVLYIVSTSASSSWIELRSRCMRGCINSIMSLWLAILQEFGN